ncbi:nuclear transport factor 2 family protein [Pseudoclavibacter endophyticus]|uniref:Nuclear transport factor 2 family protein n=1 Tax=Pseudoclavibacter endophyticus TaxID=1778590 RepID=A0A6H9WQH6_9MICO|nr:nuclear transport factor 2 family protein [Pseudoclavibacter endophyticus]
MGQQHIAATLQQLVDRQEIRDCLHRYARGLDRKDLDLLRSAFHPDATDHHGGSVEYHPAAEALINDWERRDAHRSFSQHLLHNMSFDIEGDTAHVETYYQLVVGITPDAPTELPPLGLSGGRYVDRFERRDDEWRIARRVVIVEYASQLDERERAHHLLWARRSRRDPSYDRPLVSPSRDDEPAAS